MSTIEDHPELPDGLTVVSRRALLGGGAAAGAIAFLSNPLSGVAAAKGKPAHAGRPAHAGKPGGAGNAPTGTGSSALGFAAVAMTQADEVTIPDGYTAQVLIPWGDPIVPGGRAFTGGAMTMEAAEAAAEQFGMAHDGMTFFPTGENRGLLVVNHEAVDALEVLYSKEPDWSDEAAVLKSKNIHGVSICEIEQDSSGAWKLIHSDLARRITPDTPMEMTGPAAGDHRLAGAVLGTLNNCANGRTPWGTYLTCEENFNGYFGPATQDPIHRVYGVAPYKVEWYHVDERFDLTKNPNEPYKFGWVVEIDPMDPTSTPKKRTALGRVKHENAEFAEARNGRAVVYTGDDERWQHLYKYVSHRPWHSYRSGESPLDDGTLYVARFNDDGTGDWLPLEPGAAGLEAWSISEILINTRGAADAVGATEMDRPEWVAVHPHVPGAAYGTFTNNSKRFSVTDAANPRADEEVGNEHGHILRWQNAGGDHGATTFVWSVFALAGAGLGTGDGSTIAPGDAFGSPDGLAFDVDGRLWIQTDGTQPGACNNQMLAADPETGDIRRFLVGPRGCEITGWTMTPDQRTLFVNVQHPGEDAESYANPRSESSWPRIDGDRPRSATVAIRRQDGGPIGA